MPPASPRVQFFDDMELEKFLVLPEKKASPTAASPTTAAAASPTEQQQQQQQQQQLPMSTTSTEAETGPSESDDTPASQERTESPNPLSCHSEEEDVEPVEPDAAGGATPDEHDHHRRNSKRRMSEMSVASTTATWSSCTSSEKESSGEWFGSRRNSSASSTWESDGVHFEDFDAAHQARVEAATAPIRRERDRLQARLRNADDEVDGLQRERDDALQRLQEAERRLAKAESKDLQALEQKGREAELKERLSQLEGERDEALNRSREAEASVRRSSVASQDADGIMAAAAAELVQLREENERLLAGAEAAELEIAELQERLQASEERGARQEREAEAAARATEEHAAALEAKLASLQRQMEETQAHGEDAAVWAHRQTSLASSTAGRLRTVLLDLASSNDLLRSSQYFHAWRKNVASAENADDDDAAMPRQAARRNPALAATTRCQGRLFSHLQKQRDEAVLRSSFCMWRLEAGVGSVTAAAGSRRQPRAEPPSSNAGAAVPEHRRELGRQLSALTQQAAGLRSEVAKLLEKRKNREASKEDAAAKATAASASVTTMPAGFALHGAPPQQSPSAAARREEVEQNHRQRFTSPAVETFCLPDGDSDEELLTPKSGIVAAATRSSSGSGGSSARDRGALRAGGASHSATGDLPQFGAADPFPCHASSSSTVPARWETSGSQSNVGAASLAQFGRCYSGARAAVEGSRDHLAAAAAFFGRQDSCETPGEHSDDNDLCSPLSQPPPLAPDEIEEHAAMRRQQAVEEEDEDEEEDFFAAALLRRRLGSSSSTSGSAAWQGSSGTRPSRPSFLAPQFGSLSDDDDDDNDHHGSCPAAFGGAVAASLLPPSAAAALSSSSSSSSAAASSSSMRPRQQAAVRVAKVPAAAASKKAMAESFYAWKGRARSCKNFSEDEEEEEEEEEDKNPHLPPLKAASSAAAQATRRRLFLDEFLEGEEEPPFGQPADGARKSEATAGKSGSASASASASANGGGGLRKEVMEHLQWCKAIAAARSDRADRAGAATGDVASSRCWRSSAFGDLLVRERSSSGDDGPSPGAAIAGGEEGRSLLPSP